MAIGAGLAAGVNALRNVTEIPFPEFTAKLIDGVFTAIIAATIKQMEAYADLISNLSKTLETFQTENVTEDMVTKFLIDNYPDGAGGTSVRADYKFVNITTPTEISAWDQYTKIYTSIINKIGLSDTDWMNLGGTPAQGTPPSPLNKEDCFFSSDAVIKFRTGVAHHLAVSMIDQLRAMATQGMARIVVDQVEIYSSMTFKVQTTDVDTTSKAAVDTQRFGAYVNGQVGFKAWGVKAGASYGSLSVRVANETTFSKVTMDATIIGGMKLMAHTDYSPALPPSSLPTLPVSTAPVLEFIVPLEQTTGKEVFLIGTNLTDPQVTVGIKTVQSGDINSIITDKVVKIKLPSGLTGDQTVTVTCAGKSTSLTYKYG